MKNLIRLPLLIAALALPVYAQAQGIPTDKGKSMTCPMMPDMQKDMSGMMEQMGSMMESMSDPVMKERMKNLHDKMGDMMTRMQTMHEGMGNGMMMDMNKKGSTPTEIPVPATKTDDADHTAHHPAK